ncbi:inositol monophosphatase [Candidatus Woesebacteria bacterium]|nr:inositol monophosphatase [Candidatus Woesebacteria bacterium]
MLEIAKEAAIKAGKLLEEYFGKRHTFKRKKTVGDFSTEAEKASEDLILKILRKKFPNHNILSEEAGKLGSGSGYWWVIDPLDGTIPFTSGLPLFGVSIGLLKNNEPILGVVNVPKLNLLYWAEMGKGAYLNNERIEVNKTRNLADTLISFEWGYIPDRKERIEKILSPLSGKVRYMPNLACAVVAMTYVASGVLEAYIHNAHPWDFAAGACIIKEAGGKVTDWKGKELNWFEDRLAVIASNGLIHNEIISAIKP